MTATRIAFLSVSWRVEYIPIVMTIGVQSQVGTTNGIAVKSLLALGIYSLAWIGFRWHIGTKS